MNDCNVPEVRRGLPSVSIPGIYPVVWTAQDAVGIAPGCHRMWSGHEWLLLYFFSPARVRISGQATAWRHCASNTAILVPPYCHYTIDTRECRSLGLAVHHCWFRLDAMDPTALFGMAHHATRMVCFLDPGGVLGSSMTAVVDVGHQLQHDAFWVMQAALRPVVRSLERAKPISAGVYEINEKHLSGGSTAFVPRVLVYLQQNLRRRIHIREMATSLKLSPSTISHTYRKFTGETPMQTLRRLRIQQIKSLLIQNYSLEAAAVEVGFYDAHHASREFKRNEGMTPGRFIRQVSHETVGTTASTRSAVA